MLSYNKLNSLSADQESARDHVLSWYDSGKTPFITIGGYAGTGKTTLIGAIRTALATKYPGITVAFVSYTGKAARVLALSLKKQEAVLPNDTISTIHSLIYSPVLDNEGHITEWRRKAEIAGISLIFVDEASMVDGEIWRHLRSYGIPIIAVGDHGQLPPIRGSFHLMQKPMIVLRHIHRQAAANPIIGLSIQAREHGFIRPARYSDTVIKYEPGYETQERIGELLSQSGEESLVLCGYNSTRKRLNAHMRSLRDFTSPLPQPGDRVICLRNNHEKELYNGMCGTIVMVENQEAEDALLAEIALDGQESAYHGLIAREPFSAARNELVSLKRGRSVDYFDFGYAITVHKAQGSEADQAVVFEERFPKMTDEQWRRWLYTAVTRARSGLYLFGK